MNTCTKRLMKERMDMERNRKSFEKDGIYFQWDEENIMKVKALIIGPENTPYAHGFYFFDIEFPEQYPFKPPKVKFRTTDGRTRLHPNLYVEGKVCLSILNTWSGPQWTSCQSFRTILLTLQSILDDNPITHEPSYEKEKKTPGSRAQKYHDTVRHQNYKVAVVQQLKKIVHGFTYFRPYIIKYLKENIDSYICILNDLTDMDNSTVSCLYSLTVKFNHADLLNDLLDIHNSLSDEVMLTGDSILI